MNREYSCVKAVNACARSMVISAISIMKHHFYCVWTVYSSVTSSHPTTFTMQRICPKKWHFHFTRCPVTLAGTRDDTVSVRAKIGSRCMIGRQHHIMPAILRSPNTPKRTQCRANPSPSLGPLGARAQGGPCGPRWAKEVPPKAAEASKQVHYEAY